MKQLAPADRFSVSWPRPAHRLGPVNAAGLAFYDRFVDELLANGVQRRCSRFYHWDLPQALEDDGGWLNWDTAERFADHAAILGERFSDRVEHCAGQRAQRRDDDGLRDRHARAGPVVDVRGDARRAPPPARARPCDGRVCARPVRRRSAAPTTTLPDLAGVRGRGRRRCLEALRRALERGMFTEPMLLGRYPADVEPLFDGVLHDGDLATIRQPSTSTG